MLLKIQHDMLVLVQHKMLVFVPGTELAGVFGQGRLSI
jgi:hypothetical protein